MPGNTTAAKQAIKTEVRYYTERFTVAMAAKLSCADPGTPLHVLLRVNSLGGLPRVVFNVQSAT